VVERSAGRHPTVGFGSTAETPTAVKEIILLRKGSLFPRRTGEIAAVPRLGYFRSRNSILSALLLLGAVLVPSTMGTHVQASQGESSELPGARQQADRPVLTLASGEQREALARRRQARLEPVRVINTRATWYGPGFHGRRTASGERFDRYGMTLASRHLPFGTRVRVVNPKTGKSAVARVNDRGPFGKKGVTADLSQGLARKIGFDGTGPVRLEILPPEQKKK
jgi:rare lipoprotein A